MKKKDLESEIDRINKFMHNLSTDIGKNYEEITKIESKIDLLAKALGFDFITVIDDDGTEHIKCLDKEDIEMYNKLTE